MQTFTLTTGFLLTNNAHSQKYGKIKTRDKALFEGGGSGNTASTPAKKTKSKPATSSTKRGANGASKTNGHSGSVLDELNNEDDEEMSTPSKKVKMELGVDGYFDDE